MAVLRGAVITEESLHQYSPRDARQSKEPLTAKIMLFLFIVKPNNRDRALAMLLRADRSFLREGV
jgi:hypothetical protein